MKNKIRQKISTKIEIDASKGFRFTTYEKKLKNCCNSKIKDENYKSQGINKFNDNDMNKRQNENNDENKIIFNNTKYKLDKKKYLEENNIIQIKNNENENDLYESSKQGFPNIGNTCYMNSFLQILIHIPFLISSLKKNKKKFEPDSSITNLIEIADEPTEKNLKLLKNKMGYKYNEYLSNDQEDSQEFGVKLINSLIDEEIKYKLFEKWEKPKYSNSSRNKDILNKKRDYLEEFLDKYIDFQNETFIQKTFQFFESEMKLRKSRQIKEINYIPEIDNQLSLELNYKDKNDILTLKELLINKYYKSTRKLFKLPKIFMITLIRAVIGNNMLNSSIIEFEDELDLKEFMDKDFGDYKEITKFDLYAINISSGYSKNRGHYYSYIKIKDKWYCFNDSSCKEMDPYFQKKDENGIFYQSKEVYGLFYIRKT